MFNQSCSWFSSSPADAGAQSHRFLRQRAALANSVRRNWAPAFAGVGLMVTAPLEAQLCQDAPAGTDCLALARRDGRDVVVTATRAEQNRREVGQAVTTLTRADIDRRQTTVLTDLLQTTPGVTVTRNGTTGALTTLRIRGAEGDQTLVVIDGVRVNDPSSTGGGFDFGNLLSGSVERVEILRGPNSVPWGSQAIGGVVNIQTVSRGNSLRARGEGGTYGTGFGSIGGNFGTNRVRVGANLGYLRTDGISSAAVGRERDGYRQIGGSGNLSLYLFDGFGVDLRGYYAHSRLRLDGFTPSFTFGDTQEYSEIQEAYGYAGAHLDTGWGKHRIAFTLADVNRDNYATPASTTADFLGRGRSERYEYQADLQPFDTIRAVLGAERENTRYSDGFAGAKTGITSGYLQLIARPADPLTLTGGVRHDDHDQFGGHTTLGANAALALGGTTLRASYGEGFKAPTLYQLYSAFGTRALRPETARNYDVGVEQVALGGALRASATLFARRTRDQIDFRSCTRAEQTTPGSICVGRPFGTYDNIARARARGVELALALQPVEGFTVQGAYSFIDSENRSPGPNLGRDLARRPHDSASLSADYRFGFGLQVGGTVLLVGDSFDNAANSVSLDGYALASVRAELPVGERLALYGRVENVTGERYQTVAGYGTLSRAAYGGVRLRFE